MGLDYLIRSNPRTMVTKHARWISAQPLNIRQLLQTASRITQVSYKISGPVHDVNGLRMCRKVHSPRVS